ncbi:WD40-repeat-containing domain protein [Melanogaster broomeanus]|nr:WD40-repeat-containing domain protein [Melanogaster broomeanus]
MTRDGKRMLSGGEDERIRVWDVEMQEFIAEWESGPGGITCIAISPDGQFVANIDGKASLSLSPDGTKIASASYDNTVRFWDALSGDPIDQLLLHESWIYAVTFSPFGEFVAAEQENGTLSIWRVPWWDESQRKSQAYDSLLDLPAVPVSKGLGSIRAQDEFDLLIHRPDLPAPCSPSTDGNTRSASLARYSYPPLAVVSYTANHRTSACFARAAFLEIPDSYSSNQDSNQSCNNFAKTTRKNKSKNKKPRESLKPSQPKAHPDLSNAEPGPPSRDRFSILMVVHAQAGPSTPSKPAPEGRTSSFVRSYAGSDDSWDDMDGCGKCVDYFCGGPRPDRERFHPWRK